MSAESQSIQVEDEQEELVQLRQHNEFLQEELDDIHQGALKVLEERCSPDDKHCGCVPVLRTENKYLRDFLAGCSLCRECQAVREARAIIATPRIQVEEERDALRQLLDGAIRVGGKLISERDQLLETCCSLEASRHEILDTRNALQTAHRVAEDLHTTRKAELAASDEKFQELRKVVMWVINDASFKAPEQINADVCGVWIEKLTARLCGEEGT